MKKSFNSFFTSIKYLFIATAIFIQCANALVPGENSTKPIYRGTDAKLGGRIPIVSSSLTFTMQVVPTPGVTATNNTLVTTGIPVKVGRMSSAAVTVKNELGVVVPSYVKVLERHHWAGNSVAGIQLQFFFDATAGAKNYTVTLGQASPQSISAAPVENGLIATSIPYRSVNGAVLKEPRVYAIISPSYINSTGLFPARSEEDINISGLLATHWTEYFNTRISAYSSLSSMIDWTATHSASLVTTDLKTFAQINTGESTPSFTNGHDGCAGWEFDLAAGLYTQATLTGDLNQYRQAFLHGRGYLAALKTTGAAAINPGYSTEDPVSNHTGTDKYGFDCRYQNTDDPTPRTKVFDQKYYNTLGMRLHLLVSGDDAGFVIASGETVDTVFAGVGDLAISAANIGAQGSTLILKQSPNAFTTSSQTTERGPSFTLNALHQSWLHTGNATVKARIDAGITRWHYLYQNNPYGYSVVTYPHFLHCAIAHEGDESPVGTPSPICDHAANAVFSPWMSPIQTAVLMRYYHQGADATIKAKISDILRWQARLVYEYGFTNSPGNLGALTGNAFGVPWTHNYSNYCNYSAGFCTNVTRDASIYLGAPLIAVNGSNTSTGWPIVAHKTDFADAGGYAKLSGVVSTVLAGIYFEEDDDLRDAMWNFLNTHYTSPTLHFNRFIAERGACCEVRYIGLSLINDPIALYYATKAKWGY